METPEHLFASRFLQGVRGLIELQNLKIERLPKWVTHAHVEIGKVNNSNVFMFEDSLGDKDEILFLGEFCSDLQFFLRLPEYLVRGFSLPLKKKGTMGMGVVVGEFEKDGKAIIRIVTQNTALTDAGYIPYHMPMSWTNIMIELKPSESVLAIRFIPFALYIHDRDLAADFEDFWNRACKNIQDLLLTLHNSKAGDYYEQLAERRRVFLLNKEHGVVVFGKYGEDEIKELSQVRDYLRKEYDAHLLVELPEHPSMSLEEKVKFWASASRFCVWVDKGVPSGHLVEYPHLKYSGTVVALLMLEQGASTSMIEDESTNFPYIKIFRFKTTPLEVIDVAVAWAESFIVKRLQKPSKSRQQPWRMAL